MDGREVSNKEARQDELLRRIERLERRDIDTRARVLDHERRLGTVESTQLSLQDVFRSLKRDVASVAADSDDAQEQLDDLQGRVSRLESDSWATQVWGH